MSETTTTKAVIGLDLGDKHINFAEITGDGEVVEGRVPTSRAALRRWFGQRSPCRFALEVGSQSRWVAEELNAQGHEVLVLDPRRLKLITGTLYKNDRRDATRLATAARQWAELLPIVPPRKLAEQYALTLVRARAAAVESRTKVINTIRGLLKPYGERISKEGRSPAFVAMARAELPGELLSLIEPLLRALDQLNAVVADYDKQVDQKSAEQFPEVEHLRTIYGVGPVTSLYFVALVGDPHRFSDSRSIGPYFGLVRRQDDSGDRVSELGITKAGDPLMRALLTNCAAHILGPFGKDSDLRRWGLAKLGGNSRRERNRTRVALARKLAVLMLSMWKSGEGYEPFHHSQASGAEVEIARA